VLRPCTIAGGRKYVMESIYRFQKLSDIAETPRWKPCLILAPALAWLYQSWAARY